MGLALDHHRSESGSYDIMHGGGNNSVKTAVRLYRVEHRKRCSFVGELPYCSTPHLGYHNKVVL